MPLSTATEIVEQFHLLFLAQLGRHLDKRTHVLKGGSNLRFFHGSIRYSEDMDLDVQGVPPYQLKDRVRAILRSRPLADVLLARGMEIEHVTEQKQTETVQRWKFGLLAQGQAHPLPTKIEFSHRGLDAGVIFGSLDPAVVRRYGLPSFMASHYDGAAASRQKVWALAQRAETQARDIFDLHHLISTGASAGALGGIDRRHIDAARSNALRVDFATFKGQVLAFLPPDDQPAYDSADTWETIVLEVVRVLEEGLP